MLGEEATLEVLPSEELEALLCRSSPPGSSNSGFRMAASFLTSSMRKALALSAVAGSRKLESFHLTGAGAGASAGVDAGEEQVQEQEQVRSRCRCRSRCRSRCRCT